MGHQWKDWSSDKKRWFVMKCLTAWSIFALLGFGATLLGNINVYYYPERSSQFLEQFPTLFIGLALLFFVWYIGWTLENYRVRAIVGLVVVALLDCLFICMPSLVAEFSDIPVLGIIVCPIAESFRLVGLLVYDFVRWGIVGLGVAFKVVGL